MRKLVVYKLWSPAAVAKLGAGRAPWGDGGAAAGPASARPGLVLGSAATGPAGGCAERCPPPGSHACPSQAPRRQHGPQHGPPPPPGAPGAPGAAGSRPVCRAASWAHPGRARGRVPRAALHGVGAGGRQARVRRLPGVGALGAERGALPGGRGRREGAGAPGRALPVAAGAVQALVRRAAGGAPPRQPARHHRARPPPAAAVRGRRAGPRRAAPALAARGPRRGGRDVLRRGGLGRGQPHGPPARPPAAPGPAGARPRHLQPAHVPRRHHHGAHDVRGEQPPRQLQGRLRGPAGVRRRGRGRGHLGLARVRQPQEARHLHARGELRGLDRRRAGRGRGRLRRPGGRRSRGPSNKVLSCMSPAC